MILRFLFLILPAIIFCQQDGYPSLYNFNMNLINPAFAGSEGVMFYRLYQEISGILSMIAQKQQTILSLSTKKCWVRSFNYY